LAAETGQELPPALQKRLGDLRLKARHAAPTAIGFPFSGLRGWPMRRREFIAGLGGAAAWPLAVRAQQAVRRVGMLSTAAESDVSAQERIGAFRKSLQELGWVDGTNLRIDYRWAGNDVGRIETHARELVALQPDVILADAPTVPALQDVTRAIPIVFVGGADAVAEGLVASLARSGGNVTGFSNNSPSIATKRLQLLKEIAPKVTGVSFIYDPLWPGSSAFRSELQTVAARFGMRFSSAAVQNALDIVLTLEAVSREPDWGLVVYSAGSVDTHRELTIALANRSKLPAIYGFRHFAALGGLVSYGVDRNDPFRRAASYVDRILRGAKAADLPVQEPIKFELMINLKTAETIGLTIPETLLATADEVIR
jgi:putative tryptophan/tyrosine transport system substrate-binding protein